MSSAEETLYLELFLSGCRLGDDPCADSVWEKISIGIGCGVGLIRFEPMYEFVLTWCFLVTSFG